MAQTDEEQRHQFFQSLLSSLWPPFEQKEPIRRTFAASDILKSSEGFILKSLHVENPGLLELPLSINGASKLRSVCEPARFGRDLAPVSDTDGHNCWQVDASRVTFPGTPTFLSTTIQPLAMRTINAMGVDGLHGQLEVHLHKLVFYEAGGHFTFHMGTEEEGVFAVLILQLPTEGGYRGRKMMVKREKTVKESDFEKFYTIFFADCLHELQEIISGTKLCLVFNLVKRDSFVDPTYRQFISSQAHKVEAALEPWLEEATGGRLNVFPGKLFIPLRHKYTERNFSFDVLKGDDKIVAEVLKNCKDKNNEKLDLHMCRVTKYESGDASPRSGKDHYCSNECCHMWIANVQEIAITNWIGLDTKHMSVPFKDLLINMEKEVVVGEGGGPFYSQPDEEEYIAATAYGQYPLMKHWYQRSMLVAWPKAMSVYIACEIDVSSALDLLEDTLKITDPNFSAQLHQVVCFCDEKDSLWHRVSTRICLSNFLTARLLDLCTRTGALEDVMCIFHQLACVFNHARESGELHVAVLVSVAKAMSTAVKVFGWESLSCRVLDLTKRFALIQGNFLMELAEHLVWKGCKSAGVLVARTIFVVFEARIAELEAQKRPEFTWSQPLAKFPRCPEIESFLRGPSETYVYRLVNDVDAATSFAKEYFCNENNYWMAYYEYSAIGTPGGNGRDAFCLIQKTTRFFKDALEGWNKDQMSLDNLRLELQHSRSAAVKANAFSTTTISNWSGRNECKRQRLDTEASDGQPI